MKARGIVVSLVVAAAVAGVAVMSTRGDKRPPAESPPPVPPVPRDPVDAPPADPPSFSAVRDDSELIAHWMQTLQAGDDGDVAWALDRLRKAGEPGRRAVREAALAAVESNLALAQQALDFLADAPDAPDAAELPLVTAALPSRDAQTALRAARIAEKVPGRKDARLLRALADAALAGNAAMRSSALRALAVSGDEAAAAEALRVLNGIPTSELPGAFEALAKFREERVVSAIRQAYADTSLPLTVRVAAAGALVAGGDPTPIAFLEGVVDAPPAETPGIADSALSILAGVARPSVLARIGPVVSSELEDERLRVMAIRWLAPFPLDAKRAMLTAAASDRPGNSEDVRLEALEALLHAGARETSESIDTMLRRGETRAVQLAAKVAGRVRSPAFAPSLTAALARSDLDDESRALVLRALVMSDAPEAAETIVKIMAQDHSGPDAAVSLAFNAGAAMGDASPAVRAAIGTSVRRALAGEFGELSGAGLVQLIRAAGLCCGEEAEPLVLAHLLGADPEVRGVAALVAGYVARRGTERELRAAWWRFTDPPTRDALARAIERAHFRPGAGAR